MTTQNTGGSLNTTRRTLVKGAAWSVPVVAMGSAAPAMAASQEVTFNDLGIACKLPGGSCEKQRGVTKGYAILIRVCTNVRADVTIDFTTAMVSLNGGPATAWDIEPDQITIEYNGETGTRCENVVISVEGEPNSQEASITGTAVFTWTADNGLSDTGTLNFSAASTPPCGGPAPGCTPGQ